MAVGSLKKAYNDKSIDGIHYWCLVFPIDESTAEPHSRFQQVIHAQGLTLNQST